MYYQAQLVVPRNTLKSNPLVYRLNVYPGVTEEVWVGFPPGCAGLVHVQIWDKGWQVWPTTPGTSFCWDNYIFNFEDRYPITAEPLQFVVKAWNLDDTFDHSIFFAVTIEHTTPEVETTSLMLQLEAFGIVGAQGG